MAFRTVIEIPFNGITRQFEFDVCNPPVIEQSSRLAEHPIQSGVGITDHMWVQAATLSLQGTFGTSGRWTSLRDQYTAEYIVGGNASVAEFLSGEGLALASDRLANIETLFGWLQKSGTLCSLYFIDTETGKTRFTKHENLAVESKSFTEQYNTLKFNLRFREILQVDTSAFEQIANDLLPALNLPKRSSVGTVLQDTSALGMQVVQILINEGYIAVRDAGLAYKVINNLTTSTYVGLAETEIISSLFLILAGLVAANVIPIGSAIAAVGAVTAGSVALLGTDAALKTAAVSRIAAIIVLCAAAIAVAAIGISAGVEKARANKKLREGFTLVRDYNNFYTDKGSLVNDISSAKTNDKDIARLMQLLDDVSAAVDKASRDMTVYTITTDDTDNASRQFAITLGSKILNVTVINEPAKTMPFQLQIDEYTSALKKSKHTFVTSSWEPVTNIADADSSFAVAEADGNYMFIIAPALANVSADEEEELRKKLSTYMLLTVPGPIETYAKNISDAVIRTLSNHGYKVG